MKMGQNDNTNGMMGLVEIENDDILSITYNGVSFERRTGDLSHTTLPNGSLEGQQIQRVRKTKAMIFSSKPVEQ